jgi:hypothetical protein
MPMPERIVRPQLTLDQAADVREGLELLRESLRRPPEGEKETDSQRQARTARFDRVRRLREEQF